MRIMSLVGRSSSGKRALIGKFASLPSNKPTHSFDLDNLDKDTFVCGR
jgi:molybdopterin-guanine dinucleotide biosynthesis protein